MKTTVFSALATVILFCSFAKADVAPPLPDFMVEQIKRQVVEAYKNTKNSTPVCDNQGSPTGSVIYPIDTQISKATAVLTLLNSSPHFYQFIVPGNLPLSIWVTMSRDDKTVTSYTVIESTEMTQDGVTTPVPVAIQTCNMRLAP